MVRPKASRRPLKKASGSRRSNRQKAKSYTEDTLSEACRYYDETPGTTYEAVSKLFGVPRSTLQSRHTGEHASRRESHAHQQLLSTEEEEALCDWIEHLSHMGFPVDRGTVLSLAMQITSAPSPPGHRWIRRFLSRHPRIKLGKPSGLDPQRAQAFNRSNVDDHFQKLKAVMDEHNIPWSHVYNMDEKGIQRGGGRRLQRIKYFVPRGRRVNYKLRSSNLELVTIIECVSADGGNLLPGFIFAGKEFQEEYFKDVDPRVVIAHSPNGWTDDFLCVEWFEKCFIPQANARRESDAPLLLILDGHNSHITPDIRRLAIENNVHLFLLPPHTTHRLQPLDVGVFSHLQNAWVKRCNEFYNTSFGKEMDRPQLIREYLDVRRRVFKQSLIRKAWSSSGITSGTWSADFFAEEDFAPSYATSTHAHVPPSYPKPDSGAAPAYDSTHPPGPSCTRSLSPPSRPASCPPSRPPSCTPCPIPSPSPLNDPPPETEHTPSSSHRASSRRSSRRDREVKHLRQEVEHLREENTGLKGQVHHIKTHAAIAEWHLGRVQEELHQKKTSTKKGRQALRTQAALITAGEGAELCRQQEEAREAAEAKKDAEQKRKAEEEEARQAERERIKHDDSVVFSGALSRKVKEDLKDIAFALGLPQDARTNPELSGIIQTHLASQASRYASHPKFAGLFTTANGLRDAQKRPLPPDLADENVPPPPTRRCHSHRRATSRSRSPPRAPGDIPIDPELLLEDEQVQQLSAAAAGAGAGAAAATPLETRALTGMFPSVTAFPGPSPRDRAPLGEIPHTHRPNGP